MAEDVVIVSLADPSVTNEKKFLMIQKLINYPYHEDISYFEKDQRLVITQSLTRTLICTSLLGKTAGIFFSYSILIYKIFFVLDDGKLVDLHPSF